MKRTRRIEVIRFSRRVTEFTNDGAVETDTAAEQAAIDVLLQIPEAIPVAVTEPVAANDQGAASDAIHTFRRRRLPKLVDWLGTKLSRRNR